MAFDTKYRPTRFEDVLGQGAAATVAKQFVVAGKGFHQSYLYCGPHGSGKTTMGRILARALLCDESKDGNPCDACDSCLEILDKGSSECFIECDAASKSGAADIARIVEGLEYSTFAGKQQVYLFDEAHQLSKKALDGLLKPMEDTRRGSDEKQLVCIFCTTEPEKMKDTIFSRCAPGFTIRVVSPEKIAVRLAYVCEQEGIEYEQDALVTIAAVKESHIRPALKAIEALGLLGPITKESVTKYLQLDANDTMIRILAYLGSDVAPAIRLVDELVQVMSPATCYKRLAETAMLAFKTHIKAAKPPAFWNGKAVTKLGAHHKDFLLVFAARLSSRPGKPTVSMLALDLAQLHQIRSGATLVPPSHLQVSANGTSSPPAETPTPPVGKVESIPHTGDPSVEERVTPWETTTGVHIDPRGIKRKEPGVQKVSNPEEIDPGAFRGVLSQRVSELRSDGHQGPTRQPELGRHGADPSGGDAS